MHFVKEDTSVSTEMQLSHLCPGVVETIHPPEYSRDACLEGGREALGPAAVVIHWIKHRNGWHIWWATGPSSPATLAEALSHALPSTLFRCDRRNGGGLEIGSCQPAVWVGKGGWRVKGLERMWCCNIRIKGVLEVRRRHGTVYFHWPGQKAWGSSRFLFAEDDTDSRLQAALKILQKHTPFTSYEDRYGRVEFYPPELIPPLRQQLIGQTDRDTRKVEPDRRTSYQGPRWGRIRQWFRSVSGLLGGIPLLQEGLDEGGRLA